MEEEEKCVRVEGGLIAQTRRVEDFIERVDGGREGGGAGKVRQGR